jgi:hypothetical protein
MLKLHKLRDKHFRVYTIRKDGEPIGLQIEENNADELTINLYELPSKYKINFHPKRRD